MGFIVPHEEMIIKIYFIGFALTMLWFIWLARSVFNEEEYKKSSKENQEAIDDLHESLINHNPNNPQNAYVLFSMIACIFWPIVVPYMIYKAYY